MKIITWTDTRSNGGSKPPPYEEGVPVGAIHESPVKIRLCGRGDPSPTWIEGIPVGADVLDGPS